MTKADPLFGPALDVLVTGACSAPLMRLLDVAATITCAPSCALLLQQGNRHYVISARGFPNLRLGQLYATGSLLSAAFVGPIEIADGMSLGEFARSPGLPPWVWAASVPVILPAIPHKIALVCADTRSGLHRSNDRMARLTMLAAVAVDEMNLAAVIASQSLRIDAILLQLQTQASAHSLDFGSTVLTAPMVSALQAPSLTSSGTANHAVVDFLSATLISSVRLLNRQNVSYHAVRRWRAPIKKWQLLAIRSLKRSRDPAFVELAADDLADTALRLFGKGALESVAAVPCGNSGPNCFTKLLCEAVAKRLQLNVSDAFIDLDVHGSSHPRRNASRPAMELRCKPSGSVLLIDDIATSGSHIAEATTLLRSAASSVFPLVWLADA